MTTNWINIFQMTGMIVGGITMVMVFYLTMMQYMLEE